MEIKYNIEKSQRKALAQKIADIIGADVRWSNVNKVDRKKWRTK